MAFAVPSSDLVPVAASPPVRAVLSVEDRDVLRSAALLAEDRFPDGAWGRSFMPPEGEFSHDARTPGAHQGKRALSVTGWAAVALLRVGGPLAQPFASYSRPFMMSSYLPSVGAIGHVHNVQSATPLVQPVSLELANARHTGSVISFLFDVEGPSRVIARALMFLVKEADPDGGWGESHGGGSNTLATSYVVEAISKCLARWDQLVPFLEPDQIDAVRVGAERCLGDALDWLARKQNDDGTWGYMPSATLEANATAYTAHVLAFVPAMTERPYVGDRLKKLLKSQIQEAGGLPLRRGSRDIATPSLMAAFGLRRTQDPDFMALGDDLLARGAGAMWDDALNPVRTMAYTFFLMNHWQTKLRERIGPSIYVGRMLRGFQLSSSSPNPDELLPQAWVNSLAIDSGR
jgi:hypothetical protein